jgi:hypothetical protein
MHVCLLHVALASIACADICPCPHQFFSAQKSAELQLGGYDPDSIVGELTYMDSLSPGAHPINHSTHTHLEELTHPSESGLHLNVYSSFTLSKVTLNLDMNRRVCGGGDFAQGGSDTGDSC